MHTVNFLTTLVEQNHLLAYLLILVGLILEGEVVLIATGILSHLGALNIWFIFPFVLFGCFLKTFLGYYFGKIIHEKFHKIKFFKYVEKKVLGMMPRFKEKPFWSIFISKFIYGLNNMVVIFSGYIKIDFKKYFKAESAATLLWAPLLLMLGYLFSYTALHISKEVWRFTFIILILTILFFLFDKFISWIYEIFEEFYDEPKSN